MTANTNQVSTPADLSKTRLNSSAKTPEDAKIDDSDYTSSSGSSSEDENEDEDDDNEEPTNGVDPTATARQSTHKTRPDNALKSRLAAFLPRMEESNRELLSGGNASAHRIDDVDEQESNYIEMDLSLGVLSERRQDEDGIRLKDPAIGDESESEANSNRERELQIRGPQAKQKSASSKKIEEV